MNRGTVWWTGEVMPSLALALIMVLLSWGSAHADQVSEARAKLRHVIIIMQENRSFDNYFGTFPGADGIPTDAHGHFTVCVPLDPADPKKGCVAPFHDPNTQNAGANHQYADSVADVDNGAMDGFVFRQTGGRPGCHKPKPGFCAGIKIHDVMGYHTDAEIPQYWTLAEAFVLQDHLFQSAPSWSFPNHLYLASDWSANCKSALDPFTCFSDSQMKFREFGRPKAHKMTFPWANIIWLLDNANVSWRYYLSPGDRPDCADVVDVSCTNNPQGPGVPGAWNPFPFFSTFKASEKVHPGYAASHVVVIKRFWQDVRNDALPNVAWLAPSGYISEHPPHDITTGMLYVTSVINAIARSKYWDDTVILITWDDWGGFYDHVVPPISDRGNSQILGYGLRVPGLVVSAWVKGGLIDHQTMAFDAYNRLIEDIFLHSRRLNPQTDGLPDPRPVVREAQRHVFDALTGTPIPVGDLLNDFDFTQAPLAPLVLPGQRPREAVTPE
jgi:phospholipase C